jgi:chemotaxis methyl-accepting protein methylase
MIRSLPELYVGLSRRVWNRLPNSLKNLSLGRAYGRHLHALICRYSDRCQSHGTFFLRNRPEMELMSRLVSQRVHGDDVAIAVLACSKGPEVYSILWSLRTSRPDLKVTLQAVDISQEIIDFAQKGAYSLKSPGNLQAAGLVNSSEMTDEEKLVWITYRDQGLDQSDSIFQRLDQSEMEAIFDREGDQAKVKPWLKEGINWRLGDASAPELVDDLGPQDVVVANRFLCHMEPAAAEKCLRNIAGLVKPGGFLFVSGVDLNVRTKVAQELGWQPVPDLIREIHEGDFSLAMGWPLEWWGLEPFSRDHADWKIRYASVFQLGKAPSFNPDGAPAHFARSSNQSVVAKVEISC